MVKYSRKAEHYSISKVQALFQVRVTCSMTILTFTGPWIVLYNLIMFILCIVIYMAGVLFIVFDLNFILNVELLLEATVI